MDQAITLTGIVLADGSLHLSGPLALPQCEVEVIVRPLTARSYRSSKAGSHSLPRGNYRTAKPAVARALLGDADEQLERDEYEYGGGD